MSLKTQLSHLMPVAQAVSFIGEESVTGMMVCLLKSRLPKSTEVDIDEEATMLVASMLYTSRSGHKGPSTTPQDADIPPTIHDAWKRLNSRPLLLDRMTFFNFFIPQSFKPLTGINGHMALFDCLLYALQGKPKSRLSSTSNGSSAGVNVVSIPDVLIFLGICQSYWLLQENDPEDSSGIVSFSSEHPTILTMSQWMFLVYDGYEKNGLVSRETIHRFLGDIHGENSFQTPAVKNLLDAFFQPSTQLTSREFTQSITDTLVCSPRPSHLLLDWMAGLGQALQPRLPAAESTQVFLQTIDRQSRWLHQTLDQCALAEHRLYEIKRRFHSLVETTTNIIQGDPMNGDGIAIDGTQSSSISIPTPKNVILTSVFIQAVCHSSVDQGHGGYLPVKLAERIFDSMAQSLEASKGKPEPYWDLTHILSFGGMCVRSPDEEALVRWILKMVLPSADSLGGTKTKPSMTSTHIGELLQIVCEHMAFRIEADRPAMEQTGHDSDDDDDDPEQGEQVDAEAARMLGLLPASNGHQNTHVPLKLVVENVMDQVGAGSTVTLEQLLSWQRRARDSQQRLGAFLTELQLIASVLFGVPPKRASLEHGLVEEIHRRHRQKYPQTQVSRRGPRGTVWYMIDDFWYRSWTTMVEKVSSTPEDDQDLRDRENEKCGPRRLDKIANRDLLRDGGSLALRVDIKWRQDYEIIAPLAWSALQAWYDGGPPIHRTVVPYAASSSPHKRGGRAQMQTENEIELYPFFVTMSLCDSASRGEARPFQQGVPVSRVNPVRVLLVQLCKGLDVDPDRGRLWVMESVDVPEGVEVPPGGNDWLLDLDTNIADQRKNHAGTDQSNTSNIKLLLELMDSESGLWPRGEDGKTWSFRHSYSHSIDTGDGIVGLYNMGNTCYMNASIQCLSHTPIFRDYFTSKCYLKDVNSTNPLGYQGRLAQVTAVLINSLWKRFKQHTTHQPKRVTAPGSYALVSAPSLTPKTFKESMGKFNEAFAGNEQHDAQEFLTFLLGGLSEDLNRILEKPYIAAPDSDGRPDSELADIWWSNHLKREISIVVALFTGQYKSLLKCKTCGYESARFEPFTFLTVPLPEDDTIPVTLILYPVKPGAEIMKYCVRVHSNGTLYDVLFALAKVLHADEVATAEVPDTDTEIEDIYADRAKNLVVVDMRDGYIFKIAPNIWRIPDLQNSESGELPLLHVYELDPFPESISANEDQNGGTEKVEPGVAFLALAQRKTETTNEDVLHPLSHRVFGTPLLLRVPKIESMKGRQLYDLVASRLKNFVPSTALKFLGQTEKIQEKEKSNGVAHTETEELTKFEIRQRLQKTLSDSEDVSSGPMPRYGFRLRITTRDGRRCALYPWYDGSIGCLVPDDDNLTVVINGDSLVIDWHFVVDVATDGFGTRGKHNEKLIQRTPQRPRPAHSVKYHSSCQAGKKNGQTGTISLENCLDAFAKEEKIPEAYCSSCKDFRVQTKRMSLWRLPPVVIIHLKRFQFTQHMRRKLRDFVDFPVEGLDLSRIMATDPIPSPAAEEKKEGMNGDVHEEGMNCDVHEEGMNGDVHEEGMNGDVHIKDDPADDMTMSESGESSAPMNHDDGRSEMLYDLYAVVHHQGALSGGHYVASLKSDDGQWRLFNDAQVYEIHSRDVVDASAYILFYIRRDVKKLTLDDFWNTSPAKEGEGLTEEEMNTLIRDRSERCVIS